jgi:hypothetical protein
MELNSRLKLEVEKLRTKLGKSKEGKENLPPMEVADLSTTL